MKSKNPFRIGIALVLIFGIISLFLALSLLSFRTAGIMYTAMLAWVYFIYSNKLNWDSLPSFKKNTLKSLLVGGAVALAFYIINKTIPFFAIGFPDLPISVAEDIQFFIVVICAPIVETMFFEVGLLNLLRDNDAFYQPDWRANIIKSFAFAIFHSFAYSVVFEQLQRWSDVFGAYQATLGLFVAAFTISMVFGYIIMKKEISNPIGLIFCHMLINLILVTTSVISII